MILVTGATGNVGGELIRHLAAAGEPVRALVRETSSGADALPASVEQEVGDLDRPESLRNALAGVHSVFLLGGYKDMPAVLAEIQRAGVERVILLTSRSSVVGGDRTNAIVDMWVTAEEAVQASGVPSWTILRPSGFMSNALRWLPQLRAGDVVRAPFANAAIATIDPYDIAAVAATVLTSSGENHHAQGYSLTGPEALLPEEQVRILAAALGRPLRFEPQSDDEAREEMGRTFPPAFVEAFERFFVRGEFDDSVVLPTVQKITGRAPRTFTQWAAEHASDFKGETQ